MTIRYRDSGEDPYDVVEAEAHDYRVVFWRPQRPSDEETPWSAAIHDITAEDVHEVIAWADGKAAPDEVYTLYVLHEHPGMSFDKTLLQIAGADPTRARIGPEPTFHRTHPVRD